MPQDQQQAQVIDQYVDLVLNRYRTEVRNEIRNELRAELDHRLQPQQQPAANNINGANFDELLDEIHRNSLRTNVFTVKPPAAFYGQANEVFGDWIKQLEQFMVMQGIRAGDELHRKACLESYLGGAAKAILTDAARMANQNVTYDQAKGLLQQAYPDDRNRDLYQGRLLECRQRRLETVPEYASKLRELARLAYPDLQLASRDQIIRPFFLRGLVTEIKDQVKFREFGSLEEAIKTAAFVEAQLTKEESNVLAPQISIVQGSKSGPTVESQLEALIERIDKLFQMAPNPLKGKSSGDKENHRGEPRQPPRRMEPSQQTASPVRRPRDQRQQAAPFRRSENYPRYERRDTNTPLQWSNRTENYLRNGWSDADNRQHDRFRAGVTTDQTTRRPERQHQQQRGSRPEDSGTGPVCYRCQDVGHLAYQCPQGRNEHSNYRQGNTHSLWSAEGPNNGYTDHTEVGSMGNNTIRPFRRQTNGVWSTTEPISKRRRGVSDEVQNGSSHCDDASKPDITANCLDDEVHNGSSHDDDASKQNAEWRLTPVSDAPEPAIYKAESGLKLVPGTLANHKMGLNERLEAVLGAFQVFKTTHLTGAHLDALSYECGVDVVGLEIPSKNARGFAEWEDAWKKAQSARSAVKSARRALGLAEDVPIHHNKASKTATGTAINYVRKLELRDEEAAEEANRRFNACKLTQVQHSKQRQNGNQRYRVRHQRVVQRQQCGGPNQHLPPGHREQAVYGRGSTGNRWRSAAGANQTSMKPVGGEADDCSDAPRGSMHILLFALLSFIYTLLYNLKKNNLLVMLILFTWITKVASFQICGSAKSGHSFEIPREIECRIPQNIDVKPWKVPVQVFVPRTLPKRELAHKCMKQIQETCTYVSFLDSRSILSHKTQLYGVPVHECRSAISSHETELGKLLEVKPGVFSTNNTVNIDFSWCCKPICHSTANFVIETGEVASFNGKTITTDLGDLGGCGPLSGNCRLEDATVIWNTTTFQRFCPMEPRGAFNATIVDDFIVIDQLQTAFSLKEPYLKCEELGTNAQLTDQGVVIILDVKNLLLTFHKDAAHSQTMDEEEEVDITNSKLNFLEERIERLEADNFKAVWLEMCRQSQRQLFIIWQLLQFDATMGARAFFQRTDITAEFTGQALTIWPCKTVEPTVVHYNYKVGHICYQFLPVEVDGKLLFAAPGGQDLQTDSPQADCNHHFVGVYKENGTWRSHSGAVHVSFIPFEIDWNETINIFQFRAPPIFHDQLAVETRLNIAAMRNSIYKTHRLEQMMHKLINYTAEMSFDPETLYQAIAGTGKAVGEISERYSKAVGGLFSTAVNSTTNGINTLLKGPLQALINMVIILLMIGSVLAAGYMCLCRYLQHRQASQPVLASDIRRMLNDELVTIAKRRSMVNDTTNETNSTSMHVRSQPELEGVKICTIQRGPDEDGVIPHIVVRVDGQIDIVAMVDSGAAYSLMSSYIASQIQNLELYKTNLKLCAANGLPVPTNGGAYINITVGDVSETVYAFIQPDAPSDLILGTNFLARFKTVVLSYIDSTVRLGNSCIPATGMPYNGPEKRGAISLNHDVVIPARSQVRFTTNAPESYDNWVDVIFEPRKDAAQHYGLYIASTISTVQDRQINVQVLNGSNQDKILHAGSQIGVIRAHQPIVEHKSRVYNNNVELSNVRISQLQHAVDLSETDLTSAEKEALLELLADYPQLYATNRNSAGFTNLVKHRIDTGNNKPVRSRGYRMAPKEKSIINEEIDKLEAEGIIRKSHSEWSSNIVLVRKKDGTHRMCVDYRPLNNCTRKDVYPLPRVDDLLDALRGMKYFCLLDQSNAYHCVEIDEDDKPKTAFTSPKGLFEFNRLAFGLCNAPSTYQRLMDVLLSGLQWQICLTYLDDLLVYARNHTEMLERLRSVLSKLSDGGMKLRLEKCRFFQQKVNYLGHVISATGVQPDPSKIEAVQQIPIPKTVKQLKSFLGLPAYYRKFIKDCSKICGPLTKLLKKDTKFEWTGDQQAAFDKIKEALTTAPILAHPDFSKKFIIQTDASVEGIGAVLTQIGDDGAEHPIAFGSRKLKPYEKNYGISELETLAVVDFVRHFRPYLYQQEVLVQTDHMAVKQILEKPNANARVARWGLALAGIQLDIQPRRGTANGNADALSRAPRKSEHSAFDIDKAFDINEVHACDQISVNDTIRRKWIVAQQSDESIMAIRASLNTNVVKQSDGLLYKVTQNGNRLIVPRVFRLDMLKHLHDVPTAAHFGRTKTLKALQERFFWPRMSADVREYCKTCANCQKNKSTNQQVRAKLVPIEVTGPFDRVGVDAMGPFTVSESGNRFVLVFVDYFSRYVEACATPDITATTVAEKFMELIICRHGAPRLLQSDRGTDFLAKIFKEVTKLCGTNQIHSSPYHPQSNGVVEKVNHTLATRIRLYVGEGHDDWDQYLKYATFATNTHANESTGYTPFQLLYGRKPQMPVDAALNFSPPLHMIDADDYATQVKRHLTSALTIIPAAIREAQAKYKVAYDKKSHDVSYQPGDLLMKIDRKYKKGETAKLRPLYEGPFKVTSTRYPNVTIVPIDTAGPEQTIHVNDTKPFYQREQVPSDPNLEAEWESSVAVTPAATEDVRS